MISLTKPTMVQIAGAAKAIKTERKKNEQCRNKKFAKGFEYIITYLS